MSFGVILAAISLQLSTQDGPVGEALEALEAPETLRAAFTVRLESDWAERVYSFDPRLPEAERWQVVSGEGDDDDLDRIAAAWGGAEAPDQRLFLRSLAGGVGKQVDVSDLGKAWRMQFDHIPRAMTYGVLDAEPTTPIEAELWLKPGMRRFMRFDFSLPQPVTTPDGVRLEEFRQSYLLETEPVWGLSYVSSIAVSLEAEGRYREVDHDYTAQIVSIEFFFTSPEAEALFEVQRQSDTGASIAAR